MSEHLISGKEAEQKASQFLTDLGYTIIHRNYRYKRGEIDIIAGLENLLVFVEVKFRKSVYFGYPEEAVNAKKVLKVRETAENYIFERNWEGRIRFDIISISGDSEIFHFQDAF